MDLPDYYFRLRENGAQVFRIDRQNRQGRIDMDQIAVVNLNRGDFKAHGERVLSDADVNAIEDWIEERVEISKLRKLDDIRRTVDHLNLTAHWAHAQANDDELNAVTEDLLLAMHDLRSVLVRKQADRLKSD